MDLQPGRVPMLHADATGDGPSWAAVHRDALRAVVAGHGAVLVRGLGLSDAAEVAAVFRGLAVWHPVTGQCCWFNQIAFLDEWTIDPEVREFLVDTYGAEGLPFTTCFGGGDPIGENVVQLLNEVYQANTMREPWQADDLMLVDNIRRRGQRRMTTSLCDRSRSSPVPMSSARWTGARSRSWSRSTPPTWVKNLHDLAVLNSADLSTAHRPGRRANELPAPGLSDQSIPGPALREEPTLSVGPGLVGSQASGTEGNLPK